MLTQAALALALVFPTLLAYNVSPSVTLLNQLAAVIGWGGVLIAGKANEGYSKEKPLPLFAALGLVTAAAIWSLSAGLPSSLSVSVAGVVLVPFVVAGHAGRSEWLGNTGTVRRFHAAVLLAGLASAVIAWVQVFAPGFANGEVIARSGLVGRAVGNLRQPNHLSSLLMWALVAWVPLAQTNRFAVLAGHRERLLALATATFLMWAVVLTASRTGIVGVVLLALWGVLDRRLSRWVRVALCAAPVVYGLIALGMSAWAHATAQTFGGEARLGEGDISASRFGIWANTLELIRQNPWTGVGWGEFNFAWTLTPFPGRPVAFFDHTHNLPLQLWVELGIPLGTLVLGLLVWALVQAGMRSWRVEGEGGAMSRAAFVMVLMIGVHSLFEYPLWYAYFLLPAAWAWGYALRQPQAAPATSNQVPAVGTTWLFRTAGALMIAGSLFALYDYWKVVVIYQPRASDGPLGERIDRGRTSVFFSHHADYAAATTVEPPSLVLGAFDTTTHSLLDTRLMMAWARALNESNQRGKASYLAARLREFRNPASAEFFAVCDDLPKTADSLKPFQCDEPPPGLTWRDFLPQRH